MANLWPLSHFIKHKECEFIEFIIWVLFILSTLDPFQRCHRRTNTGVTHKTTDRCASLM